MTRSARSISALPIPASPTRGPSSDTSSATLEAHDHPRRGRPSRRRSGTPSRTSRSGTCNKVLQAYAQAPALPGHRRDRHRQRHRYLTVVLNLLSGAVVFVGDGKGVDALEPFWRRLRRPGQDRGRGHGHVVGLHPGRADNLPRRPCLRSFPCDQAVQRETQRLSAGTCISEAEDGAQKILKGTRWLLLKNPENLDARSERTATPGRGLALNQPLAMAYYLKEDLRQILGAAQQGGGEIACSIDWIAGGRLRGSGHAASPGDTLEAYRTGILNYYDYPHLDRSFGGHQQQDQDDEAASLWLPGPRSSSS